MIVQNTISLQSTAKLFVVYMQLMVLFQFQHAHA